MKAFQAPSSKHYASHFFVALLILLFFGAVYQAFALNYLEPGLTLDPGADYPGTCVDPTVDCTTQVLRIGNIVGDGDDNSVLFVDSTGDLAEDSTNFYFDDATDILNIDEINLPTTSSTEGVIYSNSTRILHTYGTDNVFYGAGTGNFTLTGTDNTFIGDAAGDVLTSGADNVVIGSKPTYASGGVTSGSFNTVLGSFAGGSIGATSYNILLGYGANNATATSQSIVIGGSANSTASNQLIIGSTTAYVNDAYIGSGVVSTSPQNIALNASGGSGTDIAGASLTIAGGKGTGSASGGDVIFSTSDAGASGGALQSLTEKMRLTAAGALNIGGTNSDNYNVHVEEDARVEIVGSGYGGNKTVIAARYANGTMLDPDPVTIGQIMGEFAISGYKDTAFTTSATAYIRGVATETFTDTATGTRLEFGTTANLGTGTTTRLTIDQNGNVNVGSDTVPDSLFTVGSTSQFQVNSSGAIAAAAGVVSSGTITFSGLSTGVVINSSGTLSSSSQLAANRGGTAINTASSTGVPVITAGTWSVPTTFVYDTSGNMLGIGDTTPDFKLDVETDAASSSAAAFFNDGNSTNRAGIIIAAGVDDHTAASTSTLIAFRDGDATAVGSISFGSSATAYNTTSDVRLKDNIEDTALTIDDLMDVQVRDFTWKADKDDKITHGFIAQELYDVYPSAVTLPAEEGGYWMVDYSKLMPLTIKAIQDINIKVIDLSELYSEDEKTLGARLVAWFADRANGIQNIFAKRVTVDELCLEDVCLTKEDVLQLLNNAGGDATPDNNGGGEVTPPTTEGGENPPQSEEPLPEGEQAEGETGGGDTEGGDTGDTGDGDTGDTETGDTGEESSGDTGEAGGEV